MSDYPIQTRERRSGAQAGRLPPQALDVEQSVLGALLIDGGAAMAAAGPLLANDPFYDGRHQRIYRAIDTLYRRGVPVDLVTATEQLRAHGDLDAAGGAAYLSELTGLVASAANAEYHARIVVEHAMKRRLIETATLLVGQAYDPATDAFELLAGAERDVTLLGADVERATGGPVRVANSVDAYLHDLLDGRPPGIPSGLRALDGLTGGHKRGKLYTYAGRASMGKSAFVLGLVRVAARAGYLSAYVSLEMGREEVIDRLVAQESRVEMDDIPHFARLDDRRRSQIERAAARLAEYPLLVDDAAGVTIDELSARIKRLHAQAVRENRQLGLIAVDYLQLVAGRRERGQSRQEEIASITRTLKRLAKDVDAPIAMLSQVPREVEKRANKRPTMADLSESSSIEADSDVVGFLYRAEYYGEMSDEAGEPTAGTCEVIVAKNRSGKTGSRRLAFSGSTMSFDNLAYGSDEVAAPF